MLRQRAKHAQRVFELLVEIVTGSKAELLVQLLLYVVTVSLHVRFSEFARQCLTKAGIALRAVSLRFIPATRRPPGLTEDVRERVMVFS